jgi:putative phage-type endonuclease
MNETQQFISGTDIAAIIGKNPWKSPVQVWLEKTGRAEREDLAGNERVEWGKRLERVVAEKYQEEKQLPIVKPNPEKLFHPEIPWYAGSPDYIVAGEGLAEIKTAGAEQYSRWAAGVPEHYFVQPVWYLPLVRLTFQIEVEYIEWPVLFGGNKFEIFRQEVMPEIKDLEGELLAAADEFRTKYILADIPPNIEIDGSKLCQSALKAIWRANDMDYITTPTGDMIERCRALRQAQKAAKEAEEAERAAVNALMADIEDFSGIKLPDGSRIDWKTRAGNVSYKSVCDELGAPAELLEKHRGKTTRVFKACWK